VVELKLYIRIPAHIGLYGRRQNGRRRWSDEADAKDTHFPARSSLRRSFCLIRPLQNIFNLVEQSRARSSESNLALIAQKELGPISSSKSKMVWLMAG
jgi:hypothetical protein